MRFRTSEVALDAQVMAAAPCTRHTPSTTHALLESTYAGLDNLGLVVGVLQALDEVELREGLPRELRDRVAVRRKLVWGSVLVIQCRDTWLIRNSPLPGPYFRTIFRALGYPEIASQCDESWRGSVGFSILYPVFSSQRSGPGEL